MYPNLLKFLILFLFLIGISFSGKGTVRTWSPTSSFNLPTWNNTSNWDCGCIPVNGDTIVISATLPNPRIASGTAAAFRPSALLIQNSAQIYISGGTFIITGDFENNGNGINQTGGNFVFNNSSDATISGNNSTTFLNLGIIGNGKVTLEQNITVTNGISIRNTRFDTDIYSMAGTGTLDQDNGTLIIKKGGVAHPELTGGYTHINGGTISFQGSNAMTLKGGSYDIIEVGNTDTVFLAGNIDLNQLWVKNSASFDVTATNYNIVFNGNNWIIDGEFIPRNAEVQFQDSTVISGTSDARFHDLTFVNDLLATASQDIYVSGNFTNTGTFTHNNGTIIFNGIEAQSIANSANFYQFELTSTDTLTLGGNTNFANDLILTTGVLVDGGFHVNALSAVSIASGAKLVFNQSVGIDLPLFPTVTGVGTIVFNSENQIISRDVVLPTVEINSNAGTSGDVTIYELIINPNKTLQLADASTLFLKSHVTIEAGGQLKAETAILEFIGASPQDINGTGSYALSEININVNGAFDPVTGEVRLYTDINLENITFILGDLDLKDNDILLASTGSISGESENALIKATNASGTDGLGTGTISITKTLNAPASEDVGGLGAIFTSAANWGNTTVIRSHARDTLKTGPNAGNQSIFRKYIINPTNNSGFNATFRFSYFESELNGHDETELELYKDTSGGVGDEMWAIQTPVTLDIANNWVEKSGIDGFSPWTLASTSIPLPIELIYFNAKHKANGLVKLIWETSQEVNNDYYAIQRSKDNMDFDDIGRIASTGSTETNTAYNFIDQLYQPGAYYYRLKQVDYDGTYTYSPTRSVAYNTTASNSLVISPNPSSGLFSLQIPKDFVSATGTLSVIDILGETVKEINVGQLHSNTLLNLSYLPHGIYFLKYFYNDNLQVHKLSITK